MVVASFEFWELILALHVVAVIVSFGVVFVYPLLGVIRLRLDPAAMPWFHRFQYAVHMRVSAPALGVVFLAGAYVASHLHLWSAFFVQWGLGAVIVIGGIGGAYIAPREKELATMAEQPGGTDTAEYKARYRQAELARGLQGLITVLTVYFMVAQTGA